MKFEMPPGLQTALLIKISAVIGAALLLVFQAIMAGESVKIEKYGEALVSIEKQISHDIDQIRELASTHK